MEETKKNSKMPIIILIVILAIILIGGVIYVNNSQKPKNIFTKSINSYLDDLSAQTEEIKTLNGTISLGVNINSQDEDISQIAEYVNKAKVTVNGQMDYEQEKGLAKLTLDYDNETILDAKGSYQNGEDYVYAYVADLFDKCFSVELDSETKEQLKTIFAEAKEAASGNTSNTEQAVEILKQVISDRLSEEYFTQEKLDIEINGETVNTKKSTLTLTGTQIKDLASGIIADLKDNEEFINCFNEESQDEVKEALNSAYTSISEETLTESDTLKVSVYTTGMSSKFVKMEIIATDSDGESTVSITKLSDEQYTLIVSQNDGTENTELINSTINISKSGETSTEFSITVNVEDVGEITINIGVSYVLNEAIEDLDTTSSVNIDNLTDEEQEQILANLENMKIYELIQEIFGSSEEEDYYIEDETTYYDEEILNSEEVTENVY